MMMLKILFLVNFVNSWLWFCFDQGSILLWTSSRGGSSGIFGWTVSDNGDVAVIHIVVVAGASDCLVLVFCQKVPKINMVENGLSVNWNVDLEKIEDAVEAIYRSNQGKSKDDNDDEDEMNLVTMDEMNEKKYKGDLCRHWIYQKNLGL
jgi:hypothetical protein